VLLFAGDRTSAGASLLGDALVFASAFLLAERQVHLARAVQRLDPVKLLLAQAAVATPLFIVLSAVLEPEPTRWTPRLDASLAYQGVLIAGFCFVINLWLLQRYRPSALAALFLTQPIFGVLVAALVAGGPLSVQLLVACLAVAAGIGLSSR
jgi:drug/metabolite transporter (DMT)-like permease